MSVPGRDPGSFAQARVEVADRLRSRRADINVAVFDAVADIGPGVLASAPADYVEGLRNAVQAVVDMALTVIAEGDTGQPIPHDALAQARRAARLGITLDTLLRRYIAGSGRLTHFIIEESDAIAARGKQSAFRWALHEAQQSLLNRLAATIADVYSAEERRRANTQVQRHTSLVTRLLGGERLLPAELADLAYPLQGWHVGLIADGPKAANALEIARKILDCAILSVPVDDATIWAWLGAGNCLRLGRSHYLLSEAALGDIRITSGAAHKGVNGWRLTHREAQAALLFASRRQSRLTWCPEIALEAAVIQDETLFASLEAAFVRPLEDFRGGGALARTTLLALFDANHNITRAARRLGVARNTVLGRIKEIENLLGRSIQSCHAQLEVALRVADPRETGPTPLPPRVAAKQGHHNLMSSK